MRRYLTEEKYVYRIIAAITVCMVIIAVAPLVYIGRYAVPCADDYTYGYYTHAFWNTTHSWKTTLQWALYQVKASYDTWQGTFSSAFLMSLSPAIWGNGREGYYIFTPIIMLAMLIFSHFYVLHIVLVKNLKTSKSIWCIISSILVFCLIEAMPSPVNAFYWYNGAVHYMFMHGCMILLFGLVIQMGLCSSVRGNMLVYAGCCLMAVASGGSNYATALLGCLGILFLTAFKWIIGQRKIWNWLPAAIYVFCFYKNVTAYGNNIRQENFAKRTEIEAILGSFEQLFQRIPEWLTVPVILLLLFLVPFIWKSVNSDRVSFRLPAVVTVFSICSCACMFTPSLYAMDSPGPDRLLNIAKMWFLLMFVFNLGYWLGYLAERQREGKFSFKAVTKYKAFWKAKAAYLHGMWIYMAVIFAIVLLQFAVSKETRLLNYSSYAAYVSVRAGEAEQFYQEYLDRLEILESDETSVTLKPYSVKPWLLFFDDIEADRYNWKNQAVARWFYKEAVYLGEEQG